MQECQILLKTVADDFVDMILFHPCQRFQVYNQQPTEKDKNSEHYHAELPNWMDSKFKVDIITRNSLCFNI